jgi:hypothetical protein
MTSRYRAKYHCRFCGHAWKGPVYRTENAAVSAAVPECPNCAKVLKARGIDLTIPRAPSVVGANLRVKAVDDTAAMVMQDYKLGDLNSDAYVGQIAAPKLAPALQAQADNFFVGRGKRNSVLAQKTAAYGQAAIRGAFSQQRHGAVEPVGGLHSMSPTDREVIRPKISVVAGDGVRPPR